MSRSLDKIAQETDKSARPVGSVLASMVNIYVWWAPHRAEWIGSTSKDNLSWAISGRTVEDIKVSARYCFPRAALVYTINPEDLNRRVLEEAIAK